MRVRNVKHPIIAQTHQTDGVSGCRQFMQNRYDTFEGLQNFVPSTKLTKGLCLLIKNGGNGLDRVTILELLGEWMSGQYYAGLFFVVLYSSLEEEL